MDDIKCPHCGSNNIDYSDCYDIEVAFDSDRENEVILRHMNGYCIDCDTHDLLWTEVYEFTGYKDVRINK